MADHRARATRHARRHGQPWTDEEDRAIMAATSGLRAVAVRLGRTTGAVIDRRAELRRKRAA